MLNFPYFGPGAQIVVLEILMAVGFLVWLGWFRRRRPLPVMEVFDKAGKRRRATDRGPKLQWLGHSSFRIEWAGWVLLLDPVLSPTVSVAPRRVDAPDPACLDGVDAVFITHGHMDHFDNRTLARVAPCRLFLPRKAERFLSRRNRDAHRVETFSIGDSIQLGSIRITIVRARHGGWRYPWQLGYFACGLVLDGPDEVLYFAGDSAWDGHFADIGRTHQPTTAILPIGGYSPRWFLRSRHINPPEAVQAARDLGVDRVIPCHYGAYRVSLEGMDAPIRWFRKEIVNWQTGSSRTSGPRT